MSRINYRAYSKNSLFVTNRLLIETRGRKLYKLIAESLPIIPKNGYVKLDNAPIIIGELMPNGLNIVLLDATEVSWEKSDSGVKYRVTTRWGKTTIIGGSPLHVILQDNVLRKHLVIDQMSKRLIKHLVKPIENQDSITKTEDATVTVRFAFMIQLKRVYVGTEGIRLEGYHTWVREDLVPPELLSIAYEKMKIATGILETLLKRLEAIKQRLF